MEGRNLLKVNGILMILAAVLSLLIGVVAGLVGALAAGAGAASSLTFAFWAALILALVGGVLQLIAGIKGIKHSKNGGKSKNLIVWGGIVLVLNLLGIILTAANNNFSIWSLVNVWVKLSSFMTKRFFNSCFIGIFIYS